MKGIKQKERRGMKGAYRYDSSGNSDEHFDGCKSLYGVPL